MPHGVHVGRSVAGGGDRDVHAEGLEGGPVGRPAVGVGGAEERHLAPGRGRVVAVELPARVLVERQHRAPRIPGEDEERLPGPPPGVVPLHEPPEGVVRDHLHAGPVVAGPAGEGSPGVEGVGQHRVAAEARHGSEGVPLPLLLRQRAGERRPDDVAVRSRDLGGRDHQDAVAPAAVLRGEDVVVGDHDELQPRLPGRAHDLVEAAPPVAAGGVDVPGAAQLAGGRRGAGARAATG